MYKRELPAIVAVVYALCGSRWAAEDLAHDAFAATWRQWDQVGSYERPGAFVRRAAINLARSRARRLAAEAKALARYAVGSQLHTDPIDPRDRTFWDAVRKLPQRQREILVLRYVEDLCDAEIAEVLGCSTPTVRVHAHRARQSLATRLGLAFGDELK